MTLSNSRYSKFPDYRQIRHYNFASALSKYGSFVYVCKQGETIESVTTKTIGDPSLYWVILGCNNIVDPFIPLEIGQRLIIPSSDFIQEINK